jgi:hypothetical protein
MPPANGRRALSVPETRSPAESGRVDCEHRWGSTYDDESEDDEEAA